LSERAEAELRRARVVVFLAAAGLRADDRLAAPDLGFDDRLAAERLPERVLLADLVVRRDPLVDLVRLGCVIGLSSSFARRPVPLSNHR
jgi:hypothetical protein